MTLKERIESLVALGHHLKDLDSPTIMSFLKQAEIENPWFTPSNIRQSIESIRDQFLQEKILTSFSKKYHLDDQITPRKIGLVLAGNIPLVGFHDVLCCYITGHESLIKYSDKDKVLMKYFIAYLQQNYPNAASYFTEVERLTEYDAVIATGSNTTAKHFEFYFKDTPHIIRQNRNSIAVLSGDESEEDLNLLGADVFSYFGLGCRNVSKVFVPENYDITSLFTAFEPYKETIHHNKYKNNYDYNVALNLLNKEPFLQNELIILKEAEPIVSRIGSLHYAYYKDTASLAHWIFQHRNEIQCVLTQRPFSDIETVKFGEAQRPTIDTYADGIDTIKFLLSL